MKKYLFLLLWANFAGIRGEEAFTCDNTGEECPSKMCYYGIDHEHSCYRAGCATEEQCAGRRHNECFISNGLHTCCCMERGCAASYKGQNDCVYETKNSSDTGITTTSAADVTTTTMEATNSTEKMDRLATENDSTSKMREVPPISEEDDYSDSVGATDSEEEQEAITSAERESATTARSTEKETTTSTTSTEALTTSTPVKETSTTSTVIITRATRPPPPPSTTTQPTTTTTTTTPTTTTTSSTTTITTQTTTTATTTTTPRPTTRTTERTTTTPKMEEIRFLPDMPQQRFDSEEETSTRRPTTTTSTRTTSMTSTAPRTTTTSAERRVPVLERAREIEPARAEKSKFISAAQKNDDVPDRAVSESESSTQANGDKRSSPSLITVYEVTTSAVKNREIHETYKPPVPWWVAVAVGFIVSVVIAWAVVILLRKRKLREAEAANRKSTDKEAAVVDPLLKPSEVAEH